MDIQAEMERQISTYLDLGYAALAGMDSASFKELFSPTIKALRTIDVSALGPLPFVLVVTKELIDPEQRVPLLRLETSNLPGVVDKNHWSDGVKGLAPYQAISALDVPMAPVYGIIGVDRGDDFRGVAPEEAVLQLSTRARTPLTIDEGISLVTLFPQILKKNHCFMLAGSDRGDRRMPALWISGNAPKLGWCFKGNPHSWLGVASVGGRV